MEPSDTTYDKSLLPYFDKGRIPPSSKIIFDASTRPYVPFTRWKLIPILALILYKVFAITFDIISHVFIGPKRRTWSIKMTALSCLMRDVDLYSHLIQIKSIRALVSIEHFIKNHPSAVIKPVSFRVSKTGLTGILADCDAQEDGTRELRGDWINASSKSSRGHVLVYVHGGAYYIRSKSSQHSISTELSIHSDTRVLAITYRLAPESPFPKPLHDVVLWYLHLIRPVNEGGLGFQPSNIAFIGDSAGAALSLALVLYLRDSGLRLPGAVIVMSPWSDLTLSCKSWETNAEYDIISLPRPVSHLNPIRLYLSPQGMHKYITHPYVSPVYANWKSIDTSFLVQYGDAEVLKDEIEILIHKMRRDGLTLKAEIYEDAVHAFQTLPFLDQTVRAFQNVGQFLRAHRRGQAIPTEEESAVLVKSQKGDWEARD